MKKVILSFLMFLTFQTPAYSSTGINLGNIDCSEINGNELEVDLLDYLDRIGAVVDPLGIGIETHGNIGVLSSGQMFTNKSQMDDAKTTEQKLIIQLDPTGNQDTIKKVQLYLGLKLTQSGIGEYKLYTRASNFKVCVGPASHDRFSGLQNDMETIVTVPDAIKVVSECPTEKTPATNEGTKN